MKNKEIIFMKKQNPTKSQTTLFDLVRAQYGLDKDSNFRYYNCNPYHVKTDDCVIRAITAGTGSSWNEVVSDLFSTVLVESVWLGSVDST